MDQLASLFDLDLEKLDITSDGMNLSRSIEITSQVLELSLEDVGHDDAGPYENVMKAFSLILGCSILKVNELITTIIDVSTITKGEWWDARERIQRQPKKNRTIAELGEKTYHYTRFKPEELVEIKKEMFGSFPSNEYKFCGNKYTYEETLLIALHYMAHGTTYIELMETYGGNEAGYSHMVNWFSSFLHHKYYHRLCGKSLEYWTRDDNVRNYRSAIFDVLRYDKNRRPRQGLDGISFDRFRIFGMIDCMQHAMTAPGQGPINEDNDRNDDAEELQRAFFTNYGHLWGMKTQAVFLPNGMLANLFFASVSQNDKGMVNISGLEPELERVLNGLPLDAIGTLPAIYGDDIYDISSVIVKMVGIGAFQTLMKYIRMDIEHMFGGVAGLFKRLNTSHTWHLLSLGDHVHEHLFSIFFITNVHSCIRENKTSKKYNLPSPTLAEYLDVDNTVWYDGHNKNDAMLNHLRTQA